MKPAPADAQSAINATIAVAKKTLGERLRAIFAMGSLGYGGYVPGWSDADIDLIVHDRGENADELLAEGFAIRDAIHQLGYPDIDIKCYTTAILNNPETSYEYGSANRAVMLRESARLLAGEDVREEIQPPGRVTLIREAIAVARGLAGKSDAWWDDRPLDDTAALLALPGRLLITCDTGKVVGKTVALEMLLRDHGAEVPGESWPWLIWALSVRSIPLARTVPGNCLPDAQRAARSLLNWVVPLLDKKLDALN
jgi:hypothetical protein